MKQQLEASIHNAPSGNLKIIKCRGVEQYYMDSPEIRKVYPNGKYLRKANSELVGKLAQRSYDERLLAEVEKQLKNIQYTMTKCEKEEIVKVEALHNVYDKMSLLRKKLVNPRIVSDEQYTIQWLSKVYSGKEFMDGQPEIYTEGVGTMYPDFTCLRLTDRKQIIWEHFGMMTDPDYCQKAMKKMDIYAKNGFIQGRDIIYTFEAERYSLNTMSVELLVKEVFNN